MAEHPRDLGRQMEALIELILKVTSERDLHRLLEIACDSARVILGAEYAAIGVVEHNGRALEYFVTSGMDAETVARIGHPPVGRGVLGKLLAEGLPLRLRDLGDDPASVGFPPGHPAMRSFLGVPLASSSGLYGRLYLTEKIGAYEFSEQDEYLATALAAQVAAAFENAFRFNEIQRHAASLQIEMAERKLAEQALRQSENRFRALVENAPDGIALLGLDGKLQQITPTVQQILGYTLEESVGQDPASLTHPDDLPGLLFLLNGLMQTPGQVERAVYRFRHKDGSWRWLESTISNLVSEPSVNAIVFNYRDVTERKQSEEQVQRQLKQMNALRMIDIAISSSFDLHIVLEVVLGQLHAELGVDASAVLLYDPRLKTLEYAIGHGFQPDVLPHTKFKAREAYAIQAILERKTIHIPDLQEKITRLGTAPWFVEEAFTDYYAVPLLIKGEVKGALEIYHRSRLKSDPAWLDFLETLAGQTAIAIDNAQLFENLQRSNADLEFRVAERTAQLNQMNAELERANRAKDEFLANMSHELRTPLNSILGLSESLLEERRGSLNDDQQKSLQIIQSSGQHLLELINDILDLSKIEAGMLDFYPQPVSVDEFCKSCLSFVKVQATRKSITIRYENNATLPEIFADPRRLKQILVNLLTNAVKFTLENGQIDLQVESDAEHDLIQFSVVDDGIGISPDNLRRLFQPFVQVDSSLNRQYDGTGLGLALVQKLVDLHGGSVQVESEVGKGSRFTINLPCRQDRIKEFEKFQSPPLFAPRVPAEKLTMPGDTPAKRGLVLLADDKLPNVLTIGDYLEGNGYEVVVAYDGLEAVEKAQTVKPDIILMDLQMPVLDGLEAIARLRRNTFFALTPIIALTALAMPGDRERCLLAGANEYMSKPVSLKMLVQTIVRLLHSAG